MLIISYWMNKNNYDDLNDVHCIILFLGQCQSVSTVHPERDRGAGHRPRPGSAHLAGGWEWDGYWVHQEVNISYDWQLSYNDSISVKWLTALL